MVYMTYRINNTPSTASKTHISSYNPGGDPRQSNLLIKAKHEQHPPSETHAELPRTNSKDITMDPSQLVVENRAFIVLNPTKVNRYHSIVVAMLHLRFKFQTLKYTGSPLDPLHSSPTRGLYSVVVFQDLNLYMTMNYDDRERIEQYCRKFHVGIIIFSEPQKGDLSFNQTIPRLPISYSSGMVLQKYTVAKSPVADIARTNFEHNIPKIKDWFVFHPNHESYQTISYGVSQTSPNTKLITSVLDPGEVDGVQRIFFGHRHYIWLHKILYLDALAYITRGAMKMEKSKYLQIDIDDMFIGANGTKMRPPDVDVSKGCQCVIESYGVLVPVAL